MFIVTGGAGFIGSNLVKRLNERGETDILVVDNLQNGHKFRNLADCAIADYLDKDAFLAAIDAGKTFGKVEALFHQGACSSTTEWDGRYMMANNYEYSKSLLHHCMDAGVPFVYASSASVYGAGPAFTEDPAGEGPLNVYGYSKFLFDNYVRQRLADAPAQIAGLRYFNVYGPREAHKGGMASVAWHFNAQMKADGEVRLFEGSDGYENGEQRRDFIYVGDVVDVNLWFAGNPQVSGIYNVGTGRSQTFNEVARAVIDWHGRGSLRYVEFPEQLKGSYQSYTQADIAALRAAGYIAPMKDVASGVKAYLDNLAQ